MNAERLHAIVDVLKKEIEDTQYPAYLRHVASRLQAALKEPENLKLQEKIGLEVEDLKKSLSNSVTDDFSPIWKQEVKAMGIANLLGSSLLNQIEDALAPRDKTPDVAAAEMAQIQRRVQTLVKAIDDATSALRFFRIGNEQLGQGDFEIGFMIPRTQVNNGLEDLGNEFVELKQIIGPLSELAGESRPEVEVRTISSSEFQVLLIAAPPIAASVAYALDRLASVYERILHIRLMNKELADTEIPEDVLTPLSRYTVDLIQTEIEKIAEELIAKSGLVDEGRLNELRIDLQLQLNALTKRIERGYNVEVRTGRLPEPDDDKNDVLDPSTRQAAESVLEAQESIRFMNSPEKPVPHLEQPDGSGEDEGG